MDHYRDSTDCRSRFFAYYYFLFSTWLKAFLARAPVSFCNFIGNAFSGVPVGLIVDARVTAVKASIPLDTDQLEAHYLAEGNVVQKIQALIAASKASIELSWDRAVRLILLPGVPVSRFWKPSNLNQSEGDRLQD